MRNIKRWSHVFFCRLSCPTPPIVSPLPPNQAFPPPAAITPPPPITTTITILRRGKTKTKSLSHWIWILQAILHQRCSVRKGVLRNFAKFKGKYLCQSLFFINVAATLLKKRLWQRCFSVNFAKFLRTPFLQNTSGRLLLKFKSTCFLCQIAVTEI